MAVSQKPPPPEPATIPTECSSGDSISSASTSEVESSPTYSAHEDDDACENVDAIMVTGKARACLTPAALRVPPTFCKKGRSTIRCTDATGPDSIACLRQHLASLRSLLPQSARSSNARNVVADALRYKKVLRKQIEMLRKALPYAHQVNVKRLGPSGGAKIEVSCNKEPGLLVALMEAIESFGLAFTNVNVSCLNEKIRINAVGDMEIDKRIGLLKVALMATIMRFSQQQRS